MLLFSLVMYGQIGHGPGLLPHPPLVLGPVLGEGRGLRGVLHIGLDQEPLDPQQQLPHGDGRPPVLLLVQNGQAHWKSCFRI